jgi:hypothetical protein
MLVFGYGSWWHALNCTRTITTLHTKPECLARILNSLIAIMSPDASAASLNFIHPQISFSCKHHTVHISMIAPTCLSTALRSDQSMHGGVSGPNIRNGWVCILDTIYHKMHTSLLSTYCGQPEFWTSLGDHVNPFLNWRKFWLTTLCGQAEYRKSTDAFFNRGIFSTVVDRE